MAPDPVLVFLAMGVVTYVPRWFPLFALADRTLPRIVLEWLELLPPAILSALVAPALVTAGCPKHFQLITPEFCVAVPTFLVAWKTRSLALTVLSGMFLFWIAGMFPAWIG